MLSRRDFLKVAVAAGTAVSIGSRFLQTASAQERTSRKRRVVKDIPSVCLQCPAGCGIVVKVMDGKAVKIDGNPAHPINEGVLCPKGQAGLQVLYDPDRIRGPMMQVERGSGNWKQLTWDEAIGRVASKLQELRSAGEPEKFVFMSGRASGSMNEFIGRFMSVFGSPNHVTHRSLSSDATPIAMYLMHGVRDYPAFDWDNVNYILNFGASFLEAWRPTARHLRAYGHMRRGRGIRVRIVHVDTRLSVSASKADEWVPIKPGTDGALALGIAHVIIRDLLYDTKFIANHTTGFEEFREMVLEEYPPKVVSGFTGVSEAAIETIAKEFAATRPAVAIAERGAGMHTNGVYTRMAIHALNALVGSIDSKGGILTQRHPQISQWPVVVQDDISRKGAATPRLDGAGSRKYPLAESNYQGIPEIMSEGKVKVLFLYYTNPFFSSPDPERFLRSLDSVPFIVSFSPFPGESVEHADIILPDHTYLERYQDDFAAPSLGYASVGLRQPVVTPLYDTMNTGDVLIRLAKELGGSIADSFPWSSYEDVIKFRLNGLYESEEDQLEFVDFEDFWNTMKRTGVWSGPAYSYGEWERIFKTPSGKFEFVSGILKDEFESITRESQGGALTTDAALLDLLKDLKIEARGDKAYMPHYEPPRLAGDEREYPLLLNTYKLMTHAEGRGSSIPWLQESLGVHTRVKWDTWVEINPETARESGIKEGDLVSVQSQVGEITTRAKLFEGAMPGVVNIPFEHGHTAGGKWAAGRGANPNLVIANEYSYLGGLSAPFSTRVRVEKVKG